MSGLYLRSRARIEPRGEEEPGAAAGLWTCHPAGTLCCRVSGGGGVGIHWEFGKDQRVSPGGGAHQYGSLSSPSQRGRRDSRSHRKRSELGNFGEFEFFAGAGQPM